MTRQDASLPEAPSAAPAPNLPEYTVGELSRVLKRTVEDAYGYVRVRGEISGFKRAASGHLYFSLKDSEAVLDAVCWRGTAGRLAVKPEDGLEVVCTGRLTTYMERSRYQIVVEHMAPAGKGALLQLLEERRKKLAAEGLFDAARKKPIPFLPEVIGVVTSPTGAVIRDILHRLAERFPRRVLIWPVLVQGEGAAEQVAAAIEGFNRLSPGGAVPRPDVLIVARGGGSIEDLWAFNEEIVVRAAAASAIPLISAVGHETDVTLIDFASDKRAPTPTAAAEMAVPVRAELLARVLDMARRLVAGGARALDDRRVRLLDLGRALPHPRQAMEERAQRLDSWSERLERAARTIAGDKGQRLARAWAGLMRPDVLVAAARERLAGRGERLAVSGARLARDARARLKAVSDLLNSFSYERVLERGFVLVRDMAGHPVTAAAEAKAGARVGLRFHDGEVPATIGGAPHSPALAAPVRGKPRTPRSDGGQGSLL